jgi:alpha-amylase
MRRSRPLGVLVVLAAMAALASASAVPAQVTAPHNLRAPLVGENFYFVMADRSENGRTDNDLAGLPPDRLQSGPDPMPTGFYHGGDLDDLRERLDHIRGLGTTAIWLTPSFKNKPVQLQDGPSAGYHGYWITDFTQIDRTSARTTSCGRSSPTPTPGA